MSKENREPLLGLGITFPLGSAPTVSPAQEILYYKIRLQSDPTTGAVTFTFSMSGRQSNPDIASFIASVIAGNPLLTEEQLPSQTPPDISVYNPCYVAVELDSQCNWRFSPGSLAIKTLQDNSADYRGLTHVDINGAASQDVPANTACRVVHFIAMHPQVTANNVQDAFNFYVQLDQSPIVPMIIDPKIRNRGGDGIPTTRDER